MRVATFGLFSALLLACVSDPVTGDAGKQTGEEGGPCFSDFTCKTGLICNLGPNLCVKPGTDGAVVDTGVDSPSDGGGGMDGDDGSAGCPTTQLLAWWKGDNSGKDEQGVFDLSPVNGATYGAGRFGQAFSVDGTTQFFEASSASQNTNTGLAQFTIEGWFSAGSLVSGAIFSRHSAGQAGPVLALNGGTVTFNVGPSMATSAVTTLVANMWTHVAVTYDGAKIQIYINGAPDGMVTTSGKIGDPTTIRIGASHGNTTTEINYFQGFIDDFAMYKSVLSPSDIQLLKGGGFQKCH